MLRLVSKHATLSASGISFSLRRKSYILSFLDHSYTHLKVLLRHRHGHSNYREGYSTMSEIHVSHKNFFLKGQQLQHDNVVENSRGYSTNRPQT